MNMVPTRKAADGMASIQNIQRQAGAPNQRAPPAPPASLARISLLRKAPNTPRTIAICWSEASRPRRWAGATSEMYIGASTLAAPIARPPRILQAINVGADAAAPVAYALIRNSTALNSMV